MKEFILFEKENCLVQLSFDQIIYSINIYLHKPSNKMKIFNLIIRYDYMELQYGLLYIFFIYLFINLE